AAILGVARAAGIASGQARPRSARAPPPCIRSRAAGGGPSQLTQGGGIRRRRIPGDICGEGPPSAAWPPAPARTDERIDLPRPQDQGRPRPAAEKPAGPDRLAPDSSGRSGSVPKTGLPPERQPGSRKPAGHLFEGALEQLQDPPVLVVPRGV